MTIQENPYDVYFDIESTDIKNNGGIMEVAAIRVHRATGQVVGKYYSSAPIASNCNKCIEGEKHYKKVKDKCQYSLQPEYVFPEFLDFLRGPRNLTYPRLVGYCIEDRDLPNLIKQLGAEKEWIAQVDIVDVAHAYAYKLYPDPRYNDGAMIRSLENVAMDNGIQVDKGGLHDPLYDCELCVKVHQLLEKRMKDEGASKATKVVEPPVKEDDEKAPATTRHVQETTTESFDGDITQTLDQFSPFSSLGSSKKRTTFTNRSATGAPDGFAGRSLDPMQVRFIVQEVKAGRFKDVVCPNCGIPMTIRESGSTPITDPDHFFFGCPNFKRPTPDDPNPASCKASCNMDGTKQTDHHFDPKYAANRKAIFNYLDAHKKEFDLFKTGGTD